MCPICWYFLCSSYFCFAMIFICLYFVSISRPPVCGSRGPLSPSAVFPGAESKFEVDNNEVNATGTENSFLIVPENGPNRNFL